MLAGATGARVASTRLTLLILYPLMTIRTLRIALRAVHMAVGILRCAVNLLRLRILRRWLASLLISYRRQLWPAHLVLHERLTVLSWSTLLILTISNGFLTVTVFVLFSRSLLFFLLRFPLFSDLFELCGKYVISTCMRSGIRQAGKLRPGASMDGVCCLAPARSTIAQPKQPVALSHNRGDEEQSPL